MCQGAHSSCPSASSWGTGATFCGVWQNLQWQERSCNIGGGHTKAWHFNPESAPYTKPGRHPGTAATHQEMKVSATVSVAIKRAKTIQYIIQRTYEDTRRRC